ncbi:MAG: sodium:proton antiporter [Lachnospiraceae bacterium]|nr:sodium:proton antiporter [Lachnospiraceae bacterium]
MIIIAALLYGPVVNTDAFELHRICGFGLYFRFDGFRVVYACVSTLMWFSSTLVSGEYFGKGKDLMRYQTLGLITYGATLGVFLSADLYTTFIFFEIMSIASYAYVAHTEKAAALRAAGTYLAVAVIGGLVMLMGLMMLYRICGTLRLEYLKEAAEEIFKAGVPGSLKELYVAGGLILFGFGAKAGMFPLHIWLPKAHPVAPAPASALLSGVLTKSGIFGVLVLCLEIFGESFGFGFTVVVLGLITMVTGALLAVFSTDLKRTLACSSVSQIGFILTGIGLVPLLAEESTLALSGALLYMVNHSLFKLVLFLCAAAVYMKCHKLDLNEIQGFGRDLPVLKILFLIGALGISGVPLLSGYVAKTLIHEGMVEYIHMSSGGIRTFFKAAEWVYLISGGMTFAYMTKLFWAVFVDKPKKEYGPVAERTAGRAAHLAIVLPAFLIVFLGIGAKLYVGKVVIFMGHFNTAAFDHEQTEILHGLHLFSLENLKGSAISIAFGIVIFVLIRKFLCRKEADGHMVYLDRWPKFLDIEELIYRPLLLKLFPFLFRSVGVFVAEKLPALIYKRLMAAASACAKCVSGFVQSLVDLSDRTVFAPFRVKKADRFKETRTFLAGEEKRFKVISATLSYGMLLICFGLIFTLIYLLYLLFS